MTNEQKYMTPEERIQVFNEKCVRNIVNCINCPLGFRDCKETIECFAHWLALPCEEEKPEPCFFCGDECACERGYLECLNDNCCYSYGDRSKSDAAVIAAHNRVARAVMAAKKGEVK